MKSSIQTKTLLAWLAMNSLAAAQHAHINAGALGTGPDSQLYFVNGANFVTNSGYLVNLSSQTSGPFAGKFEGSITFTALPATANTGGPAFGHAALGAKLELEIASVTGPRGGEFGIWQEDDLGTIERLFVETVGLTNGTRRLALSENDGSPGADPFGHIHGRHFTASLPGLYTVGFRVLDTSANGPNGAPIHAPSEIFPLYFQAGHAIASLNVETNIMRLVFGSQPGRIFFVESTASLEPPVTWKTMTGPLPGANRLQIIEEPTAASPARYFRLRVDEP